MVTFETKLSLNNYLKAELIRINRSLILKIFLALYLLYLIWGIVIKDKITIMISVFFLLLLTIFVPVFKYLSMKYRFKIKTQVNFFDKEEFGIVVGDFKRSVKKDAIKSIEFGKDYVFIKLKKGSYGIPSHPEDIRTLRNDLSKTEYKKFIL